MISLGLIMIRTTEQERSKVVEEREFTYEMFNKREGGAQ